jgi:hypothetical protein
VPGVSVDREVASFDERRRCGMTATPYWIQAGDLAMVLVHDGVILIVVYWQETTVGVDDDGEFVENPYGYYWFAATNPQDHFFLQEADNVTRTGWETACELASHEHFDPMVSGDVALGGGA